MRDLGRGGSASTPDAGVKYRSSVIDELILNGVKCNAREDGSPSRGDGRTRTGTGTGTTCSGGDGGRPDNKKQHTLTGEAAKNSRGPPGMVPGIERRQSTPEDARTRPRPHEERGASAFPADGGILNDDNFRSAVRDFDQTAEEVLRVVAERRECRETDEGPGCAARGREQQVFLGTDGGKLSSSTGGCSDDPGSDSSGADSSSFESDSSDERGHVINEALETITEEDQVTVSSSNRSTQGTNVCFTSLFYHQSKLI